MAASTALLQDILGPIRPLLAREDVTDLCIDGPGLLFVEGAHGWERIPADNLTGTWLHPSPGPWPLLCRPRSASGHPS